MVNKILFSVKRYFQLDKKQVKIICKLHSFVICGLLQTHRYPSVCFGIETALITFCSVLPKHNVLSVQITQGIFSNSCNSLNFVIYGSTRYIWVAYNGNLRIFQMFLFWSLDNIFPCYSKLNRTTKVSQKSNWIMQTDNSNL